MPLPVPSDSTPRARTVRPGVIALVAMATLAVLTAACGSSTATVAGGPRARLDGHTRSATATGTAAERHSATAATTTYQATIAGDASSFVGAVTTLESALTSGDVPAARADELEAQADFDQFRWLETAYTGNAAALDELASAVPPGQEFGGLHAVEQALWPTAPVGPTGRTPGPASTAAAIASSSGLVAQAPVADYLLGRLRLSPEVIGTTAVHELGWVAAVALPGREEEYSHHDDVDVAATVGAADRAFDAIEPLAFEVDPALAGRVQARFTVLLGLVESLGPPTQVVDSALSDDTRVPLTGDLDATAALLSTLAARLTPFGTTGPLP